MAAASFKIKVNIMSFQDDVRHIYQREKDEYARRVMDNQKTLHPEYEFECFEDWKKERGYE